MNDMQMKKSSNDKTLESYKAFPIVAWVLVIGFASFVYNIALNLQDVADSLEEQADRLEQQVDQSSGKAVKTGA